MHKLFQFICLLIFLSCSEEQSSSSTIKDHADTTAYAAAEERIFDVPVLYKNWELGSHQSTRTVLKMYQAWDGRSVKNMTALLADSVILDLPDGKRRAAARDKMVSGLLQARKDYLSTSNNVLAVFPIHNNDKNEEWVSVLVYNKWTNKDNTRDSMLYQDLWKVKDGKITYLLTLEQAPSRGTIKQLDAMTAKN